MRKNLKKLFLLIAVVMTAMLCLAFSASAAKTVTTLAYPDKGSTEGVLNGYSYQIKGEEVSITGYSGKETSLVMPTEIGGKTVTNIAYYAFTNLTEIKSVTLPEKLESIYGGAFENCTSLESIVLPDTMESITSSAFHNTAYYNKSTNWDKGVALYIGKHLIEVKDNISGAYAIKEGTLSVPEGAFANRLKLTAVTIPASVKNIQFRAFAGCTSLAGVKLAEGVETIGYYSFSECTALKSLTLPKSLKNIGSGAFSMCKNLKSITIPQGVTSIESYAFEGCASLTGLTIPKSVTSIGGSAFCGCKKIKSITIPDGITILDNCVFEGCTGLKSITLPGKLTRINEYTFYGCTNLSGITIPKNVTYIGDAAFGGCKSLNSITLPVGVTEIGYDTFKDCTKLSDIKILGELTAVACDAFANTAYYNKKANWNNNALYMGKYLLDVKENISGAYTIKSGTTVIAENAFHGCSEVTSVTIPGSVKNISYGAFAYCYGLTGVTISNGVKTIDAGAFEGCEGLKKVSIPGSVKSIGEFAFWGCKKLEAIKIPKGVESIGNMAFCCCDALGKITLSDSISSIGNSVFDDTAYYKNSSNWQNKVLYIGKHLIDAKDNISGAYTVKKGTLTIATAAFDDCTKLTGVTIPGSVRTIGISAFSFCEKLVSAKIANGVVRIGDYAFNHCTKLANIKVPDSVTYIGDAAFNHTAYSANASNWENGVLYIGKHVIDAQKIISGTYAIKAGTLTVSAYAFSGCEDLTGVTIPDSVKTIGDYAFYTCESLESVTVLENVTEIGEYAFGYIDYLKSKLADFTVIGKKGTAAEKYAKENGFIFEVYGAKPAAPTTVKTAANANAIKLSWNAVSGATGYRVYMYNASTNKWDNKKTLTGTSCTVSNLQTGVTYQFKVVAYKTAGGKVVWGNYSSTVSAKTKLLAPATVKTAVNANAIKLAWSKVAGADGYRVYMYNTSTKKWDNKKTLTGTSYLVNNLKLGGTYQFKIVAYKMVNGKAVWGDYSSAVKATTKLLAPTNIKTAVNASAVKLTWSKVTGADGYRVYLYNVSTKKYTSLKTLSATSYMVSNLKSATTYYFKVIAYKKVGSTVVWGDYSPFVTATTKPATPQITAVASTAKGRVAVAWSNVAGETGYELYASTKKDSGYKKVVTTKTDDTKGIRTDFVSGRTYYFKVVAYKTVGNTKVYSAWSNVKALKVK